MAISNDGQAVRAPITTATSSPDTLSNDTNITSPPVKKQKLYGRAFYESIGSPKFVLAPMVDQSEFAWRLLSRSFMTPTSSKYLLAYTPMLHARLFNETPKFRDNHFQPLRQSLSSPSIMHTPADVYLDGNPAIDRPLTVQFCANDPDEFLSAAKYVAPFCDAVDLNLGCPQGIAKKGKYGAFLQEDQDLVFRLIRKLHEELDVPVTAKIRILDSRETTLAYARKVLDAGASILTVHGRQREQKGHNTGLADWNTIRWLREQLGEEVVLFANGNILQRGDIDACLEATGADGVMSAEGNLYDPAIFAEAPPVGEEGCEYWRGKDGKGGWRMDAVFRRYMDIIYNYVLEVPIPTRKPLYLPSDPEVVIEEPKEEEDGPPRKKQKQEQKKREKVTNPNMLAMQAHSFHLLRALVSKHHSVRDALARSRSGDIAAYENVLSLVTSAVESGIREYEASNGQSWEEELAREQLAKDQRPKEGEKKKDAAGEEVKIIDGDYETSVEAVKRCKRPWWVVQPYVRPLPMEALAKGSMTLSRKEKAKMEREAIARGDREKAERVRKGEVSVSVKAHTEAEEAVDVEAVEVPKGGLVCG